MKTSMTSLFTSAVALTWFLQAHHAAAQETISLGTDVSGTISAAGEEDWYSVATDVLGDLVITQTAWPPFIETRVELYGPGDQTTLQANTLEAAAPGVYYIKVYSANSGTSTDVYTFNASLTPAATGNDRDGGGNAPSAAIPTSIGTEESGTIGPSNATAGVQDEDWYSVTFDVVGDLTVTQTAWPPFIETRIDVFGPDDPTLAQDNPVNAAAPGTYYFRVWSTVDGASSEIYTFNTSIVEASTGNDIDGGSNEPAGAVPIEIGDTVTDTIAPSSQTAGTQDEDWYVLSLASGGDLTVTQTVWPPFLETRIAVFGPDDPTISFTNPASPGDYFIRVWSSNNGSSIDPYEFTTEFTGEPGGVGGAGGAGAAGAAGMGDAGAAGMGDAGAAGMGDAGAVGTGDAGAAGMGDAGTGGTSAGGTAAGGTNAGGTATGGANVGDAGTSGDSSGRAGSGDTGQPNAGSAGVSENTGGTAGDSSASNQDGGEGPGDGNGGDGGGEDAGARERPHSGACDCGVVGNSTGQNWYGYGAIAGIVLVASAFARRRRRLPD
jgi:hypothetical protein